MNTHVDQIQESIKQSFANEDIQKKNSSEPTTQFVDNSPEAKEAAQLQAMADNSPEAEQMAQLQEMADNNPEAEQTAQLQSIADSSPEAKEAAKLQAMADEHGAQEEHPQQKKVNNTGLPDDLKTGIENLSGFSMDDVKVHYNSSKPAELQAHAYAEGTDIYIGPGQEKHLPHEAWHVVQQKQGRVKPTLKMEGGLDVNDDKGLEKEADVMGGKALIIQKGKNVTSIKNNSSSSGIVQRYISYEYDTSSYKFTNRKNSFFPLQKGYSILNNMLNGYSKNFTFGIDPTHTKPNEKIIRLKDNLTKEKLSGASVFQEDGDYRHEEKNTFKDMDDFREQWLNNKKNELNLEKENIKSALLDGDTTVKYTLGDNDKNTLIDHMTNIDKLSFNSNIRTIDFLTKTTNGMMSPEVQIASKRYGQMKKIQNYKSDAFKKLKNNLGEMAGDIGKKLYMKQLSTDDLIKDTTFNAKTFIIKLLIKKGAQNTTFENGDPVIYFKKGSDKKHLTIPHSQIEDSNKTLDFTSDNNIIWKELFILSTVDNIHGTYQDGLIKDHSYMNSSNGESYTGGSSKSKNVYKNKRKDILVYIKNALTQYKKLTILSHSEKEIKQSKSVDDSKIESGRPT